MSTNCSIVTIVLPFGSSQLSNFNVIYPLFELNVAILGSGLDGYVKPAFKKAMFNAEQNSLGV